MGTQALKRTLRDNRCYFSLACSIGSISLACGSLLQIPNTSDRISLQRGLFLTSLGFIYFVSLTEFCNKYLLDTQRGLQFRKKYHLMMSDVLEITNKLVSAIQAAFSFLVGLIVCKSTCSKSFVYASHFLMEAYGWFGTAYFMYDIWSMYKVHTQKIADKLKLMSLTTRTNSRTGATQIARNGLKLKNTGDAVRCGDHYEKNAPITHLNGCLEINGKGSTANGKNQIGILDNNAKHSHHLGDELYDYDGESVQMPKSGKLDFLKYVITHPVMMIHHVFIGTFGLLVVTYIRGGGHCIYSYMYMMEFSTPFVSLRSILSTMNLKDSNVYIINGLTMLGTFFVCRVFMWPYVMWRYSVAIDATLWQAIVGLPRGCIISILILFLPQIYWFFLMVKGAMKVFSHKTKHPSNAQNQQLQQQSKNNNLSPVTNNGETFYISAKIVAADNPHSNGTSTTDQISPTTNNIAY